MTLKFTILLLLFLSNKTLYAIGVQVKSEIVVEMCMLLCCMHDVLIAL